MLQFPPFFCLRCSKVVFFCGDLRCPSFCRLSRVGGGRPQGRTRIGGHWPSGVGWRRSRAKGTSERSVRLLFAKTEGEGAEPLWPLQCQPKGPIRRGVAARLAHLLTADSGFITPCLMTIRRSPPHSEDSISPPGRTVAMATKPSVPGGGQPEALRRRRHAAGSAYRAKGLPLHASRRGGFGAPMGARLPWRLGNRGGGDMTQ